MTDDLQPFKMITPAPSECGCGAPATFTLLSRPGKDLPFVEDEIDTPAGSVPRIATRLTAGDWWGTIRTRWGVGRMTYGIPPGLYAIGTPNAQSEVLVTANYKLTFDLVRRAMAGGDFWILVLNSAAINVWCAAGKGTFGTDELIRSITSAKLDRIVGHRRVIAPQLGAPGIAAHKVKEATGFKVVFGPVRIEDLPVFLAAGKKASPDMRRKRFPLRERVVLIPVELVTAAKWMLLLSIAFFLLSGLGHPAGYWAGAMSSGVMATAAFAGILLGGAILTPILLPWLPGRAFSVKSLPVGMALGAVVVTLFGGDLGGWSGRFEASAWMLIIPALTAFLAMNFTGASTYTSLSGVQKEMRVGLPLQLVGAAAGLMLWITSRFTA